MKNLQKGFFLFYFFLSIFLVTGCSPQSRPFYFGNMGAGELIIIIAVILVILGLLVRNKGAHKVSGPTLVLRKFRIDNSSIPVEIVGRASGITAWLLTIMGLDALTNFSVHNTKISIKSSSLSGEYHKVVPLKSISSTHCGYSKPISLLILGILFFLIGIIAEMVIPGLIVGGIFVIVYFLTKKISISLETSGGMIIGLSFKRSVIENISIDLEQAQKVITIINDNILKQQSDSKDYLTEKEES